MRDGIFGQRSSDGNNPVFHISIRKTLSEEELFPAREELLRMLAMIPKQNSDEAYVVIESDIDLMPHPLAPPDVRVVSRSLRPVARLAFAFTVLAAFAAVSFAAASSLFAAGRTLEAQLVQDGMRAAAFLEQGSRAAQEGRFDAAAGFFREADVVLSGAEHRYASFGAGVLSLAARVPFTNPVRSGDHLVRGMRHIANAGEAFAQIGAGVSGISVSNFLASAPGDQAGAPLAEWASGLLAGISHLNEARAALANVDIEDVPQSFQSRFRELNALLDATGDRFQEFSRNQETLLRILGAEDTRRYLLLFQNASELRPTGGFIGNVGLVTIRRGRLESFTFQDVYDLDGQLTDNVVPPYPLQDITTAWSLHDANWFFDFPTSARLAALFFEKAGGPTVDGVIAITSRVAEDLLAILGPLALEGEDGTVLAADSFVDILNAIGETEAQRRAAKSTIGTFAEDAVRPQADLLQRAFTAILARLRNGNEATTAAIGELFARRFAARDIQIYFLDEEAERLVSSLAGTAQEPVSDGVAVVHSNINGFKTDRVLVDTANISVELYEDGSADHELVLTRAHQGERSPYGFYRRVNKDYLRIYLPRDAQILAASGFSEDPYAPPVAYDTLRFRRDPAVEAVERSLVHDASFHIDLFGENGARVVGGWVFVSPGERAAIRLRWRTRSPLSQENTWAFRIDKQAGNEPLIAFRITYPSLWQMEWETPLGVSMEGNTARYQGVLEAPLIVRGTRVDANR